MEDELVLRAKEGDKQAFDELYQKYKRPILNYVYRFIGNRAYAEEITQETFVRAYVNIQRFEPRAKFSSWLYRIAGNLAKNYFRHAKYEKRAHSTRRTTYDGSDDEFEIIDSIEDKAKRPDESAQSKETQKLVQKAINELPPQFKEVLILCDIEGLSYEDAAEVMRCKPMTIGSRLWRAREKLAKMLHFIKNGEMKR